MLIKANDIKTKANGYYSFCVKNSEGALVEGKCSKVPTQNVVTYAGAYRLLFQQTLGEDLRAVVGTSTVERTRSSTDLGNRITGVTASYDTLPSRASTEVDNLDGTSTITGSITSSFSLGDIVGTITEIGVETDSGFVAGQLIKDEFGDPTTVTLLADEQLIVTYTLEFTVPNTAESIGTGTVDADGVTTTWTMYSQPFFADQSIGGSNYSSKYFISSSYNQIGIYAANGTSRVAGLINTGTSWSFSHDGSGNVSATCDLVTYSPSDWSASNAVWFLPFTISANTVDVQNTTTGEVGINDLLPVSVKFDPAINKTSSQSLSIQFSFSVTV